MSDLRSELIAKLGATAPTEPAPSTDPKDPLSATAHIDSDWCDLLRQMANRNGVQLAANPSFGAAENAHHVLIKKLKSNGLHRDRNQLIDAHSRYTKKREKVAWARLKSELNAAGQSAKLYRAIKSGSVPVETVLNRWTRIQNKGWNAAQIRTELLRG